MPRLSTATTPLRATPLRAPPLRESPRPAAKAKSKKLTTPPDRLKTRTLFFRRVKRSIKPGLWVLAAIFSVAFIAQAVRAIPAAPVQPAALPQHSSFARLAAAAGFRVANIKITGVDNSAQPAIQTALGINPGDPIFGVSIADAAQRIAQVGSVQSAVIERELPATIVVTITPRAAFAIWQTGSGATAQYALIDKSGNIIANQNAVAVKRAEPDLLLVVGQGAAQHAQALQAQLDAFPSINQRIIAAEWVDGLRWNLTLKDLAVIKLPMNDVPTALAQLAKLQTTMQLLDRPVAAIDMRLPNRMVVHPDPKTADQPNGTAAGHP